MISFFSFCKIKSGKSTVIRGKPAKAFISIEPQEPFIVFQNIMDAIINQAIFFSKHLIMAGIRIKKVKSSSVSSNP